MHVKNMMVLGKLCLILVCSNSYAQSWQTPVYNNWNSGDSLFGFAYNMTTGWYDLTTSDTLIYRQYADTSPYTGQFIAINAKTAGSGTQLVLTTTWTDPGGSGVGSSDVISGGTGVSSPATSVGAATAPTTLVTYFPPSSTYLTTTSWGTPTIAAAVA